MDEVIFASRSSDHFLAFPPEFFGSVAEDSAAILRGFGIDNVVDSSLDFLTLIDVNVKVGVLKMLVAVVGDGVRRALGTE